jgi:tRNA threonylcarbamoyl adenosine modification protein (Sua5/YciO/YrdC/YwlC family)
MAEILRLDTDPTLLVKRCREVLAGGELLIVPTDTVYGLVASVEIPDAVDKVFAAKGRDTDKALVVMVSSVEEALGLTVAEERTILTRLGYLWPGALTLVVKAAALPWTAWVAPGSRTLGIRVPDDSFMLRLLAEYGPLAVTSANRAGERATSSFADVDPGLLERVGLAVDGGEHGSGKPSTVTEIVGGRLRVLRSGDISEEKIRAAVSAGRIRGKSSRAGQELAGGRE